IPDFTSGSASGLSQFKPPCSSVLGRASKRISLLLTKTLARQGSFAPRELPRFFATISPSDSRPCPAAVIDSHRHSLRSLPGLLAHGRVSQVPRLSFDARCPLSPRVVHPLHTLVASRMVSGFGTFGRLTTTDWCNEAETGSLALRLASSPSRSSTGRLPATPPSRLHGERAIAMVSTLQLTRSARLNLADRKALKTRNLKSDTRQVLEYSR